MTTFQDHFSAVSSAYARFRPRYPGALFMYLARLAPGRELAWDCATGSGQAALGLAPHFRRVVATDASAEQIRHALAAEGVEYRTAPAESSGLPDASVDLILVAQALHWLDLTAFYPEARRVLVPGGVLAASCYGLVEVGPGTDPGAARRVNESILRFYDETVGPYWPPERHLVDAEYRTVPFPFEELAAPSFTMTTEATLDELGGYLATWSATRRYRDARGDDPVPPLLAELEPQWGDGPRTLCWRLVLRVGKVRQ